MLELKQARELIKANIAMGVPKSKLLTMLDIDRKTLDNIIGFTEIMTELEVCKAYGVSRTSLRSLVKDGLLTIHIIDKEISYKTSDIKGLFK